jgi:hypothetical protein
MAYKMPFLRRPFTSVYPVKAPQPCFLFWCRRRQGTAAAAATPAEAPGPISEGGFFELQSSIDDADKTFVDAGSSRSSSSSSTGGGSTAGVGANTSTTTTTWGSGWRARRGGGSRGGSAVPRNKTSYFATQTTTPEDANHGKEQQGEQSSQRQEPAAQSTTDPEFQASLRRSVDRASETLQEVITEVLNELLIEQAGDYLLQEDSSNGGGDHLTPGGAHTTQQAQDEQIMHQARIILLVLAFICVYMVTNMPCWRKKTNKHNPSTQAARGALAKRLEWLDANFLAALNAYLALPGVQGDADLHMLLGIVRSEVLELVAARLPAPVQVLHAALQHGARIDRAATASCALGGGSGAVPGTSLSALGAAAHQLLDDMEDQQAREYNNACGWSHCA